MRSVAYRYEKTLPSELFEREGRVLAPPGERGGGGEWVIASFSAGTRSTALPGRFEKEGDSLWIRFADRDWQRLLAFAQRTMAPPSNRPFKVASPVRDIPLPSRFPSAGGASDALFVRILHLDSENQSEVLTSSLCALGMVVELKPDLDAIRSRLATAKFDIVLLSLSAGYPELRQMNVLRQAFPSILFLCLGDEVPSRQVVDAYDSGVDDFLDSGQSAAEIAAKIVSLLRRHRSKTA